MKKNALALAAAAEAGTGLLLLLWPAIVVRMLFGAEIDGAGVIMSRLAGIALIGLGVACWPGSDTLRAFYGMFDLHCPGDGLSAGCRESRSRWHPVVAGRRGPRHPCCTSFAGAI